MVTNLDLLLNKRWFMENMLAIANKNAETQRLLLNPAQLKAHELLTGANRAVILKARQMGISTYVLGSFFHDVITTPNLTVAIISHEDFATQRLFDKVKIFLDHLPKAIRPQVSHNSTHELVFTKLHSTMYVGTGGCFTPDTQVMVEGGNAKPISEIKVGDRIYSGRAGNLTVVEAVIPKHYSGRMFEISTLGNSDRLTVTPDHKFRLHKRWVPVSQIVSAKNARGKRVCKFIRQVDDNVDNIHGLKTDYELGWVLGLYLAEGWYSQAYTSFGLNLNETDYRDRLKKFADSHGYTFRWRQKGGVGENGMEVSIGSVKLAGMIDKVIGKEKCIPDWWWQCGKDFLNGVIDGYVAGDGSEQGSITKVSSVRPHLLYQLRDMILSVRSQYSGIYKCKPSDGFGKVGKVKYQLDFPITKGVKFHSQKKSSRAHKTYDYVSIPIKFKEVNYDGLVYDLTCGGSFNLTSCLVHNSRSFGRGDTIHRCLVSELAFYGPNAEKLMNGLQEAVPNSGTLWVESTPQGEGNYFHKLWRQAAAKESNFKPVFLPWHLLPEYQLPVDSEFANPLDKGHLTFTDEERQLVDKYGITEDQVRWRRMKMAQKRQLFFQEYPEDAMSCFLSSGMSVFDLNKLGKLTLRCREPNEVEDNGALRIWQLPREGEHYIIGADVAEGMTKGWSAAVVVNAASLEHVATLRGRWETNIYGQKLADLGTKYNGALVAVERNSVGNSVLNTLVNQVNYPNVYMEVDARGLRTGKYGWVTSVATKPLMVANARSYIESYSLTTWDEKLMADLRRLRYLPGYKIGTGDDTEYDGEEEEGSHSDIAMAMFIALIVRQQAPTQATGIQRKKSESY